MIHMIWGTCAAKLIHSLFCLCVLIYLDMWEGSGGIIVTLVWARILSTTTPRQRSSPKEGQQRERWQVAESPSTGVLSNHGENRNKESVFQRTDIWCWYAEIWNAVPWPGWQRLCWFECERIGRCLCPVGTNQRLQHRLNYRFTGNPNIQIYGYVADMSALMDSAEFYLTKPGGIKTMGRQGPVHRFDRCRGDIWRIE